MENIKDIILTVDMCNPIVCGKVSLKKPITENKTLTELGDATNARVPAMYKTDEYINSNVKFNKGFESGTGIVYWASPKIEDVTTIYVPSTYNGCPVGLLTPSDNTSLKVKNVYCDDNVLLSDFKVPSLETIVLPKNITYISDSAFEYCANLKNVVIPNNVEIIKGFAFRGCTSLVSINIPDSVKKVWTSAFASCSSLTTVTGMQNVNIIQKSICLLSSFRKFPQLPNVTEIHDFAFSKTKIPAIYVPAALSDNFSYYEYWTGVGTYIAI